MPSDDFPANTTTTGVLSVGASASGVFEAFGDTDWFKISLVAGNHYNFSVLPAVTVNHPNWADIELRDPNGVVVLNPVLHYSSAGSFLTYLAAVGGDYYLVARNANSLQPGTAYQVTAQMVADEAGDTGAGAAAMAVGQIVSGAFQVDGDTDFYKLELPTGTTYTVTPQFAANGGPTPSAYIYDPSGYSVGQLVYGTGSSFSFTTTTAGEYYLALGGTTDKAGAYTVRVDPVVDDYGSSASNAGSLTLGNTVQGKLEVPSDRDWFGVDLQAGQTYWFTVAVGTVLFNGTQTPTPVNHVRLYDGNGNSVSELPYAKDPNEVLAYTATATGRYYLEVAGYATGSYTVTAKVGTADDYSDTGNLTRIAVGDTIHGQLGIPTDRDSFRVAVKHGQTYLFELMANNASAGAAPTLSVTDTTTKFNFELHFNKTGVTVYKMMTAVNDGDFLLNVDNGSDIGTAGYTLKVSTAPADDYSASINTSGVLTPGVPLHGVLDYVGDIDTFKISVQTGVKYAFTLQGAESGGGTLAPNSARLALFDAHNNSFALNHLLGSTSNEYTYISTVTGDIYLELVPLQADATTAMPFGSYTVKMDKVVSHVIGPALSSITPASGAGGTSLTPAVIAVFDQTIQAGSGTAVLTDASGVIIGSYKLSSDKHVTITDNVLTIKPGVLHAGTSYTLTLSADSIHDVAGNTYLGDRQFGFTTASTVDHGSSGNDLLAASGIGSMLDGGAGVDTAVYSGVSSAYIITRGSDAAAVHLSSATGQSSDQLTGIERIQFLDKSIALDINGNGGQAYRLYQAAFNRAPDLGGLGFWIHAMDQGATLSEVASSFVSSAEFLTQYGSAQSDSDFVTILYANVLHRTPDTAGLNYWINNLHSGLNHANALVNFSESAENQSALLTVIGNGFEYTPYS